MAPRRARHHGHHCPRLQRTREEMEQHQSGTPNVPRKQSVRQGGRAGLEENEAGLVRRGRQEKTAEARPRRACRLVSQRPIVGGRPQTTHNRKSLHGVATAPREDGNRRARCPSSPSRRGLRESDSPGLEATPRRRMGGGCTRPTTTAPRHDAGAQQNCRRRQKRQTARQSTQRLRGIKNKVPQVLRPCPRQRTRRQQAPRALGVHVRGQ